MALTFSRGGIALNTAERLLGNETAQDLRMKVVAFVALDPFCRNRLSPRLGNALL